MAGFLPRPAWAGEKAGAGPAPGAGQTPTTPTPTTTTTTTRFVVVQPTSTEQIGPGVVVDAAVDALRRRSLDVVPGRQLTAEEKACGVDACLRPLLARTGATHALLVRFGRPDANEQSDADVTVFSAADKSIYEAHVRDGFSLPKVFTARMAEAAGDLAARVVTRSTPGPSPLLGTHTQGGLAPRASLPTWERVLPWAVVAAGGASLAVGVGWLATNGESACAATPCRQVYDTRSTGWALVGGGAAVAAIGVAWVVYVHRREAHEERHEGGHEERHEPGPEVALVTDLRTLGLRGTF